jgi:CTP-dependent riboflavin kinase|tara:strand:- start:3110 stop:3418 length:309 start_codon:yes stop_codon:yes gene_type:complete
MKSLVVFVAAATLSMSALAGNMPNQQDMKEMHDEMHNEMNNDQVNENILQNKELQRLHKEMTRNGMSEGGMEARVQMMSKEGRAYHRALEMKQMEQNLTSSK